jgi:hypothetical protein
MKMIVRLIISPVILLLMIGNSIPHTFVWIFDKSYDHEAANKTSENMLSFMQDFLR